MTSLILNILNKDIFIIILSVAFLLSIIRILQLKKLLIREINKRLYPQLLLKLINNIDTDEYAFCLVNESPLVLKDIKAEDTQLTLTDAGFAQTLILRFKQISFLKSNEKINLAFKVFDKQDNFIGNITEKIIPHLSGVSFQMKIHYATIEGRKLIAIFSKKGEEFYMEKIETPESV